MAEAITTNREVLQLLFARWKSTWRYDHGLDIGGFTRPTRRRRSGQPAYLAQRDFDPAIDPGVHGSAYQDVRFLARGDGVEIAGWYVPAAGAQRAIILVHGRDASRSVAITGHFPKRAAAWHKAGFAAAPWMAETGCVRSGRGCVL